MTKKQHKAIAEMWSSGLLLQSGMDSFENSIAYEDQEAILKEVDKIALKLQKGRRQKFTLKEIIEDILLTK